MKGGSMQRMWAAAAVLALGAPVRQAQSSQPAKKPEPAAKAPAPSTPPDLSSEDAKTLYALGASVGRDLTLFAPTPEELQLLQRGITDSVNGTAQELDPKEY